MTLPKQHTRGPGRGAGRPRYTDEPTLYTMAQYLVAGEQLWRDDCAANRITLTAIQVELSREYLENPEVRERVLRRAVQKSQGKLLDGA